MIYSGDILLLTRLLVTDYDSLYGTLIMRLLAVAVLVAPLLAQSAFAAQTTPATDSVSKATSPGFTVNTNGKTLSINTAKMPEGATAKCKDGSFSFEPRKTTTCSGHMGVAQWFK